MDPRHQRTRRRGLGPALPAGARPILAGVIAALVTPWLLVLLVAQPLFVDVTPRVLRTGTATIDECHRVLWRHRCSGTVTWDANSRPGATPQPGRTQRITASDPIVGTVRVSGHAPWSFSVNHRDQEVIVPEGTTLRGTVGPVALLLVAWAGLCLATVWTARRLATDREAQRRSNL